MGTRLNNLQSLTGELGAASQVDPGFSQGSPDTQPVQPQPRKRSERVLDAGKQFRDIQIKSAEQLAQNPRFAPLLAPTITSTGAFFNPLNVPVRTESEAIDDVDNQAVEAVRTKQFDLLKRFTEEEDRESRVLKEAIENFEKKKPKVDLTAIGALIDDFTGSNLVATYEKPMSDEQRQSVIFNLKRELAKREQNIANEKMDLYRQLVKDDRQERMDQFTVDFKVAQENRARAQQGTDEEFKRANLELNKARDNLKSVLNAEQLELDETKRLDKIKEAEKEREFRLQLEKMKNEGRIQASEAKRLEKEQNKLQEKFVPGIGHASSKKNAQEATKFVDGYVAFTGRLKELIDLRKEAGRTTLDPAKIARGSQLVSDIKLQKKEIDGLGVLSKNDFQLLEEQVPAGSVGFDPLGLKLTKLQQLLRNAQNNAVSKLSARGLPKEEIVDFIFKDVPLENIDDLKNLDLLTEQQILDTKLEQINSLLGEE